MYMIVCYGHTFMSRKMLIIPFIIRLGEMFGVFRWFLEIIIMTLLLPNYLDIWILLHAAD